MRAFAFPRFAGTPAERRAAQMAAARFGAAGLVVAREPFRASVDAIRLFKLVLHLGGATAASIVCAAAAFAPAFGASAGAATLYALVRLGRWSLRAERAFDSGRLIESQNIVARRSAAEAAPRVVFLAHLDSKSMRWPTAVATSLLLVAVGGLAVVTAWSALAEIRLAPPLGAKFAAGAAAVIAAALLAGLFNSPGDESPGAMDNASGVAVLLDLAERLPRDDAFSGIDLTFVATGAEEIGLAGAMRWIARHEAEYPRERTLFINFDSVGVGDVLLAMNARDGELARVVPITRMLAARGGPRLRLVPGLLGVGVDTMPIAARGFATITILGDVLGPASRRFHSRRDTVDHVHEAGLVRAAELGRGLALAWAKSVESGAAPPLRANPNETSQRPQT